MHPRRSRSIQAQEPSSTNISWLSDDLLAKCFAPLDQEDRLCSAALVCRRWRTVCSRPDLQLDVEFTVFENPAAALPAAQSLLWWLVRHGSAVRIFDVKLWGLDEWTEVQKAEMMSLLDSWLALCSNRLEKLSLGLGLSDDLTVRGWALALPHLQELKIDANTLNTWVTLQTMTALQRLEIAAQYWQLGSAVRLPTSLTRLHIASHRAEEMPSQVSALTNLRSLELSLVSYSADSMARLTRLSSLQHASFTHCKLPDSLPELTGLQVLEISYPTDEYSILAASLDSALCELTKLTGLWLYFLPPGITAPASLAALSRLQWLCILPWSTREKEAAATEVVLPQGPWQRSLRHLIAPFPLMQSNLPFLSGAKRLQRLSFLKPLHTQPGAEEQRLAFRRWAVQHEPLQRLQLLEQKDVEPSLMEAVLDLKERRPALHVEHIPDSVLDYEESLRQEMLAGWDD